jgi:adenosylmethionine-8-amino-7-oxononanoate aminotransferase
MNLATRDQKTIWHPFTQHQMSEPPLPLARGEGAYLIDHENNRYLDLISSWWVNLHGHAHPEIAKAIYEQALTLEHAIFSGFTHEPAVSLAEKLLQQLPTSFSKVFYSDNGSTAVEVALKMAYQYWQNRGECQRKQFIAFEHGYHGDTVGSMSLGKKSGFFNKFKELLIPQIQIFSYPATWMNDEYVHQKEQAVIDKLSDYLQQHHHEIAAMIIEPLVQGASGMNMCTPRFLQQLEKVMKQYGILIIYDEVMTGFGRTGEMFACLTANTTPDIICLAKGLTGGFMPLSATVCSENIYQTFLGNDFSSALAHGHSFTANPLGCAAALASMNILLRDETQQQIRMIEKVHHEILHELTDSDVIEKKRYCGTIMAFNLAVRMDYGSNLSLALRKRFLESGLLIRPLGDVIYFLPPYCISEHELRKAYEIVVHEIQGVTA